MSAHEHLKAATRAAHERLDARFARLDLSDAEDYRIFLAAHARAFLPCEAALSNASDEHLPPGWRDVRRSEFLVADCQAMGVDPGPLLAAPFFDNPAAIAGGLYVLEGSRLGARFLAKAVDAALPHAFLSADAPKGHWRAFLDWLGSQIVTQTELDAASRAATQTFAVFERAGEGAWGVE